MWLLCFQQSRFNHYVVLTSKSAENFLDKTKVKRMDTAKGPERASGKGEFVKDGILQS